MTQPLKEQINELREKRDKEAADRLSSGNGDPATGEKKPSELSKPEPTKGGKSDSNGKSNKGSS
jgi:hypothetical protein